MDRGRQRTVPQEPGFHYQKAQGRGPPVRSGGSSADGRRRASVRPRSSLSQRDFSIRSGGHDLLLGLAPVLNTLGRFPSACCLICYLVLSFSYPGQIAAAVVLDREASTVYG